MVRLVELACCLVLVCWVGGLGFGGCLLVWLWLVSDLCRFGFSGFVVWI